MNVIVFLVDDLGWSDVACYGSSFYETPNIDRLSAQGVLFTSAYAACHVCSPTRASLLTGKYPASINLTDWLPGRRDFPFQMLKNVEINQHLPYGMPTLPVVLKEYGYSTAIIGKWHLGEDSASTGRQGFDLHIPDWDRGWPKDGYHFPYGMRGLEKGEKEEYLTDRLTDEAMKYLEMNQNRPFFLYMSHFAVHDPIQGRSDLVDKYREKLQNSGPANGPAYILEVPPGNEKSFHTGHSGFRVFPDRSVKIKQHQDNIQFAAMVESMDESLGRILDKLEELDLADNTLLIFYSDNGGMSAANFWDPDRVILPDEVDEAFSTSNLPLRGAKGWLYEGGIRVPLIVNWPGGGLQGAVCDVPVTSPDFYPTILDVLGIPFQPEDTDGASLVPLLKGEEKLEREAIYWHFPRSSIMKMVRSSCTI
jgi:arylsulfatase A-like enzyme